MPKKYLISGLCQRFLRLNKRFLEDIIKKSNITYEQYHFLYMLSINPSCNQSYLCEFYNAKKSLVSNVLRSLEDKNYITQTIDPDNRRSYIINLTPEGFEVLNAIREKDIEFENQLFNLLGVERAEFMENMEEIYNIMLKNQ